MKTLVVISTAGSEKEGWKIAQKLVEAKLAACVNVIPKVTSFFYWEGKLCQAQEVVLLIKTIQKQLKKIINEIKKIHSYEIPEVISLQVDGGEEGYLKWVNKMLAGKK
ncbi:MAG: divalent-cation tolerance protein CutA [Deltaproteobacteria bacterium]|jgi:periplasmic divalent cation tolerance protein|nr:divalent-cation tolerance protein CutA [Deltaproteobacteria bacterium]MDO9210824.1 divalent-cation tolerance protein CutA [Deltaproteobacteria bacterium]